MLIEWTQRIKITGPLPKLTEAQEIACAELLERAVRRAIETTFYGGQMPPRGGEARTVRTSFAVINWNGDGIT
jgi:hypothetical protein